MSQDLLDRLAEFRNAFDRLEANVTAATRRGDSAKRYEDFVRAVSDWVWETDDKLNLTYVSDGIARASGVPGPTLLGGYLFALNRFRQIDDTLLDLVERVEAHRPFRNVTVTLTPREGETRSVLLSGVPVFSDTDGKFTGYRGTGVDPDCAANRPVAKNTDATAQPLPEAKPAAAEPADPVAAMNRHAIEAAGIGAWEWDIGADTFRLTGGLARRLDMAADGGIDAWYGRVHADDAARVRAEFCRHISGDSARLDIEHRLIDGDGQAMWVVTRGLAERDATGKALSLSGASTDVTARMQAEDAQRSARETAETASRAKTAFLTHLSHELRTPLNAVIGFSEAIKDNVFGELSAEKAQEYAGDIHAAGNHLLLLIDDILDLSRVEAGEMVLDETEVDIERAVNAAARFVEGQAVRKHLSLNVAFGAGLPHLRADERVVKQVALNLLSNAVKFTPDGGVVSVRAVLRADGGIRMEVSDTGIGIADEDLQMVLKPFGRVTGDLSVTPDGVGIGLPLSKSLIELHGGTLVLRSAKGCGTDAVVDFPAERSLVAVAAE